MSLEIVRCTTATPAFRALVQELDAEMCERYGEIQTLYNPHNGVDDIETAVVATLEGIPVGCGCFKLRAAHTIELKRMYVKKDHRGRRIAAQVIAALEAWARELGHTTALLETGNRQHEAVALYVRCGYVQTPCYPPYDQLPASICMRKDSAPAAAH